MALISDKETILCGKRVQKRTYQNTDGSWVITANCSETWKRIANGYGKTRENAERDLVEDALD
jgi:hypothetical protein